MSITTRCVPGIRSRVSGDPHGAPYVLLWNSLENLEEYDAGEWPAPSQIVRRSIVASNGTIVLVTACRGRFIRVQFPRTPLGATGGWVNDDELVPLGTNAGAASRASPS